MYLAEVLLYSTDMKRTHVAIAVSLLVLGLVAAEVFYFRFHTYFQQVEVSEPMRAPELPPSSTVAVPKTIAQGSFVEIDAIHKGSGTARIIQETDGSYVRFENFRVTNGPDLYVYLSDTETPGNTLASLGNYTNLGVLKGNVGDQNYDIPATHTDSRTVVIWCEEFGVLFSYAPLR